MIYILIGVYLWAGLTANLAYSIGFACGGISQCYTKTSALIFIVFLWPIVIPFWYGRDGLSWYRARRKK